MKGRGKSGQASNEAAVVIMFLLFIVLLFMAVLSNKVGEVTEQNYKNSLAEVAEVIEAEVNIALGAEEGYSHSFTLPPRLAGGRYRLEFINATIINRNVSLLRVHALEGTKPGEQPYFFEKMFPRDVLGNFTRGINTVKKEGKLVIATPRPSQGQLYVQLDAPGQALSISKFGTFTLEATVSCGPYDIVKCGNVDLYAMKEDMPVPILVPPPVDTPFTTADPNPQSCGELTNEGNCQKSWTITATGGVGESGVLYVRAVSDSVPEAKSEQASVSIIS